MTEQSTHPQAIAPPNSPRDLIARLYREIGISAVAAALESSTRAQKKPTPNRVDIPAVLRDRDDEAA